MGFFSWKTCDTDRSIANNSSERETFEVHMITPDGRVFTEKDYDGYGEFGGKDFYELLGELNGLGPDRSAAIDLCFKNNTGGDDTPGVVYPKFVETLGKDPAKQYDSLPNPVSCEDQGFFYGDDEDDDDDYDYEDDREDEDDGEED
jgi:hypothetical protein